MTLQNQIKAWLIMLGVVILALWVFRGILLPFVVGMALAYLLDPVADQLEKWKFSRIWATALIMVVSLVVTIGLMLLVLPLLINQFLGLMQRLPQDLAQLQVLANEWLPEIYDLLGAERAAQIEESVAGMIGSSVSILGNILAQVMQSGLTIINALGLLVVTPVVAFYLLLDWDRMVAAGNKLLPVKHQDEIRGVLADMDRAMAGVIRGQASVVALLSIFYATSLSLAGLSFGLAIGLIAGVFSFVPYVGFLVGFFLSLGVATVQFWPDAIMIGVIFVIFVLGQFLEGNVLYPKLVGGSIGVHPVWLMFALFAFGLIFGFVGLLLAVPMAAIASVLAKFGLKKYEQSVLYLGEDGKKRAKPAKK